MNKLNTDTHYHKRLLAVVFFGNLDKYILKICKTMKMNFIVQIVVMIARKHLIISELLLMGSLVQKM
jgi:ABC-type cobalamin transport system permease subunit